jgi:hypothetical protein
VTVRDSSAVRRLFVRLAGAVERQSALHKENIGFVAPTPGRHISTFRFPVKSALDWASQIGLKMKVTAPKNKSKKE